MIVKTSKKNEALDTKMSSAFLLYGNKDDNGFYITQECYDKIMGIEFYRIVEETGEEKLVKDMNYRALVFVYKLHRINDEKRQNEKNSKYYGVDTLREFSDRYYLDILNKLEEAGIIEIYKEHETVARVIWVCENWLSNEPLKISDKGYWKINNKIIKKGYTRGKKHTSDKKMHIDITKDEFLGMFKDKKDYKEVDYLKIWSNIESINNNGEISACQKLKKRSYSLFTSLSSRIHDRVTLDGRYLAEIDGHATYFSFLPAVIDIEIKKIIKKEEKTGIKNEFLVRLQNDNAKLRETIKSTKDIYSLFVDANNDRNHIKTIFNSFLNTPEYNNYYNVIKNYIKINFPTILTILDQFRKNNKFFYTIQKVEAEVYIKSARILKKKEIDVIVKHDCALCYPENLEKVKKVLIDSMTNLNLFQNLKEIDHSVKMHTSYANPTDSISNSTVLLDKLQNHPTQFLLSASPSFSFFSSLISAETESLSSKTVENLTISSTLSSKTREKLSTVKIKNDIMTVYIKNKKFTSKKNETTEQFKIRVEKDLTKKEKELIIWPERSEVMSEVMSEASEIKSLTTEIKGTILKKDKKKSLEVDLSQDVVEMGNYTKISQKDPEEARNGQCDSVELSDTIKLILGVK